MFEVHIDTSGFRAGLRALLANIENGAQAALQDAAHATEQAARNTQSFDDKTGQLRASIHTGPIRFGSTFVEAGAEHAGWIEDGTKGPYEIRAKGRALRFEMNGTTVFRKSVMHPGIKARHFMRDAAIEGQTVMQRSLESNTDGAIRRFNA